MKRAELEFFRFFRKAETSGSKRDKYAKLEVVERTRHSYTNPQREHPRKFSTYSVAQPVHSVAQIGSGEATVTPKVINGKPTYAAVAVHGRTLTSLFANGQASYLAVAKYGVTDEQKLLAAAKLIGDEAVHHSSSGDSIASADSNIAMGDVASPRTSPTLSSNK